MSAPAMTWEFEDEHEFTDKLEQLVRDGTHAERIRVFMPVPVARVAAILGLRRSRVRLFTLAGGLTGLASGFAFTIYTVKDWPLVTGGKPIVSIPPFVIIAFALTILFGALVSFAGFLLLARLPAPATIAAPREHQNRFIIQVAREEEPSP